MPPDPARVDETAAWLRKARSDLDKARHDLQDSAQRFLDDVAFHAQQAAEKALKGYLSWHDVPFRKTHDLIELGKPCVGLDPTLEPLLRTAAPLSEYAWKYRYPGQPEAPTPDESQEALAIAERVVAAVLARLPSEVVQSVDTE